MVKRLVMQMPVTLFSSLNGGNEDYIKTVLPYNFQHDRVCVLCYFNSVVDKAMFLTNLRIKRKPNDKNKAPHLFARLFLPAIFSDGLAGVQIVRCKRR